MKTTVTTTTAWVEATGRAMYDAEVALHLARQTGVDSWIAAAYDRLHERIAEHDAALTDLHRPRCA